MDEYLKFSKIIDWNNSSVLSLAKGLSNDAKDKEEIVERCFRWVRDEIKHSRDYALDPVTLSASETLHYRSGYCYAKSHLLAALLRANNIPAALCYQRVSIDESGGPFCLHGLNAVYLEKYGWYRIDPRGNKPGICAEFCPPVEKLAFQLKISGEYDIMKRFSDPLPEIVEVLTRYRNQDEVYHNLPDLTSKE